MKKLIDEKGRIFGKVSLLDIFVVLFALVMVLAIYLRFFSNETTSIRTGSDTFTYTLRVNGVRMWTVDGFHVGDKLWDWENDIYLGTITGIETTPATWEYDLINGSLTVANSEGRYDLYLSVEVDGLIRDGRHYASRTYEVGVNGSMAVYTKYCSVTGTVWSID